MTEHFHIPGAWDPAESVLARLLRRRDPDTLRAEATFYVVAVGAVFGYLVLVFVGWAWINRNGVPGESEAATYWIAQASGLLLVTLFAWVGRRGATRVEITDQGVRIQNGGSELHIGNAEILEISRIPNLRYHQHYRRYARTRSFRGKVPPNLILLRTESFPVVLGIRPAEQALFLERVGAQIRNQAAKGNRVA